MRLLNFKTSPAAMKLAQDEAMLSWADAQTLNDQVDTECLRIWQFDKPTVVLGRSSKIGEEVNQDFCSKFGIQILRRCTGGASVLSGPGCLMYSVVLRVSDSENLRKIDVAHDHVMTRVLTAVREQLPSVDRKGICDLTFNDCKFSGNSLRVSRNHLLYHGTFLLNADLDQIEACLDFAPRQPDYRDGRSHRNFVTNVPLETEQLAASLANVFGAQPSSVPTSMNDFAEKLFEQRYSLAEWHARR